MINTEAAILAKLKSDLVIEEIEIIQPLLPGQVLIKMESAAICGSQIGEINGVKGEDKFLPHLLGHEGVARVLEIGEGVKFVDEGDRVIVHWMKGAGFDTFGGKYKSTKLGKINSGPVAIFSKNAVVSENRLTKIKFYESPQILSTVGCGLLTAYGVLENDLNLEIQGRGRILISGFGGIGQLIFLIANLKGNFEFHIFEKNLINIQIAKDLGITKIYRTVEEIPIGYFDFNIELTGIPKNIETGYSSINSLGTLCLVGVSPKNETINLDPMPLHYGKKLIGSFGGAVKPEVDVPKIIKLITDNQSHFAKFSMQDYSLPNINQAISDICDERIIGRARIIF
jgi:S-(hydroxymethyl)glutathione dehydrogenase / alcohol dehydrogenase